MRRFVILFAALAFSGPAFAADMAVKAPLPTAVAAPYSWTGFYVGGNVGYGWGNNQTVNFTDIAGLATIMGTPAPITFDPPGLVAGFQLGYNWQFNRIWVVGFETDFDWSGGKGSGTSTNISNLFSVPLASTATEKLQWFGTVRGRLGFLPTNNLFVYGTGGLAYGRVAQSVNLLKSFEYQFFRY